jgi:phosphatidylserine decarboxylase
MNTATCALSAHQYVDRRSGSVVTERLIGDRIVSFVYNRLRENAPTMFKLLTSARISSLLAYCCYDMKGGSPEKYEKVFKRLGIDRRECVEPPGHFTTMRRIFERQIRYWDYRPMEDDPTLIVSPADARLLIGSFAGNSRLFFCLQYLDFFCPGVLPTFPGNAGRCWR